MGLKSNDNVYSKLGMNSLHMPRTPGWCPRSNEPKVVKETEREKIVINSWGYTVKELKTGATVPQFLDHPVKDPEQLDEYLATWDEPDDPKRWGDMERKIKDSKEEHFVTPTGLEHYESAWRVIGFENLLSWMYKEPKALGKLLDALTEYFVEIVEYAMDLGADGFWFFGDIADNHGPFMTEKTYRRTFYPHHRKIYRAVRNKGGIVVLHTDGDVRPLIPHFIKAGINVLQPIDAVAGMDVTDLKEKYGDQIAFIGNIDNSNTLPFGSTDDVEEEVHRKISTAGQGGGYVCGSSHSVPDSVPVENYLTLIKTTRKYGRYQ